VELGSSAKSFGDYLIDESKHLAVPLILEESGTVRSDGGGSVEMQSSAGKTLAASLSVGTPAALQKFFSPQALQRTIREGGLAFRLGRYEASVLTSGSIAFVPKGSRNSCCHSEEAIDSCLHREAGCIPVLPHTHKCR